MHIQTAHPKRKCNRPLTAGVSFARYAAFAAAAAFAGF
jgi:hypothetical protein